MAALQLLGSELRRLREAETGLDLTIVCADGEFQLQSAVACAFSPVICASLKPCFLEAKEQRFQLADIEVDTLRRAVDHACGASMSIDHSNVMKLLALADQLQNKPLLDACEVALRSILVSSNARDVADACATYNLPELER